VIYQLHNPLTEDYLDLQRQIDIGGGIPWYIKSPYEHLSTFDNSSQRTSYFSHAVLDRSGTKSYIYDNISNVLHQIADANSVSIKQFFRINLNYVTFMGTGITRPHTDHVFPHKLMIVYLSADSGGRTRIFKDKFSGGPKECTVANIDDLTVLADFNPTTNSIMMVDGLHLHSAIGFDDPLGKRVVLLATFEEGEWQPNMRC